MHPWRRPSTSIMAAVLALTASAEAFAAMHPSAMAQADVCVSAGRRISVSGCTNVADAVAPYSPPPSSYAPLPEDYPPPAPNVSVCANLGRRITVSGCL